MHVYVCAPCASDSALFMPAIIFMNDAVCL